MNLPSDVGQEALDASGIDFQLGDIQDGTKPAQILNRRYGQCLRQLLRAANWNFARRSAPLQLLADATGQTPNVGTVVPIAGFVYEYALPIDCAKVRFIPWNFNTVAASIPPDNIQIPSTPIMTGLGQANVGRRFHPAPFVIATDPNYPPQAQPSSSYVFGNAVVITAATQGNPCQITAPAHGLASGNLAYFASILGMTQLNGNTYEVAVVDVNTITLKDAAGNALDATGFTAYVSGGTLNRVQPALVNPAAPGQGMQYWEVQGVSPTNRTVILTNVKEAHCVYTQIMLYPSTWDPLFRMALVAYLASEIAFPLATWNSPPAEHLKRQQMGLMIRKEQIALAKDKIREARAVDGNEGFSSSDIPTRWMDARWSGGGGFVGPGPFGAGIPGLGVGSGLSWDACGFADGSSY